MSINRGLDKEVVVHICNGILLSHKKEQNWIICRDVDGPGDIIQSEVSQKEKNNHIIMHICGFRRMVQIILFAKQK